MNLSLTLAALQSRHAAGEHFDYLHFWGHRQRADGTTTTSCFSQWYPARFEIDDIVYPTFALMIVRDRMAVEIATGTAI